jgi:hypothetical protein
MAGVNSRMCVLVVSNRKPSRCVWNHQDATTLKNPIMLRSVFLAHRFLAGGFGLSMLLAPEVIYKGFDPNRIMPIEELITLKSWACFMIIVALVVHHAANFPLLAQLQVARSMLVGFVLITIIYIKAVYELGQSDMSRRYMEGVAATGATFFTIAAAYAIALYKDSQKGSIKSA